MAERAVAFATIERNPGQMVDETLAFYEEVLRKNSVT